MAICDGVERDLGDPTCVFEQLHVWDCTWKSVPLGWCYSDDVPGGAWLWAFVCVCTHEGLVVCARVGVTEHKYASAYVTGSAPCTCEDSGAFPSVCGCDKGAGASLYQTGSGEAKGTPATVLSQCPM